MLDSLETRHLQTVYSWLMKERNDLLLLLLQQNDPITIAKVSGRAAQVNALAETVQYLIDERANLEEENG